MEIKYLSKNYKISNNFKDIMEKKLSKLDRYFKKGCSAKVNCIEENGQQKLEVTINAAGMFLRSEVVSDNMYNNIDIALPKIERQIVKNTGKYKNKFSRDLTMPFEFLTEEPVFAPVKVLKKKKFKIEPLTVEDAENYMEALGHSFYIFLNVKTGQVNVIYKRNDGNAGLIEVEY